MGNQCLYDEVDEESLQEIGEKGRNGDRRKGEV